MPCPCVLTFCSSPVSTHVLLLRGSCRPVVKTVDFWLEGHKFIRPLTLNCSVVYILCYLIMFTCFVLAIYYSSLSVLFLCSNAKSYHAFVFFPQSCFSLFPGYIFGYIFVQLTYDYGFNCNNPVRLCLDPDLPDYDSWITINFTLSTWVLFLFTACYKVIPSL